MIKYYISIFCLVLPFIGKSQDLVYPYDESVLVIEDGTLLRNAWSGGFNSAQYSSMDLNNDAIEDLVVFERSEPEIR